jgi:hypothetical protein
MKKASLFLLLLFPLIMIAQNPPMPTENMGPPPPPGLPLDGGLLFLFIAGVAYGVKKIKD